MCYYIENEKYSNCIIIMPFIIFSGILKVGIYMIKNTETRTHDCIAERANY